ncbi:P-loop containing nucleoside triphosphate hydrolase protein [Chlamydoabsidia padenii]|nr:P-loop containing nucleoside triphosphate hydrolase protein [Chlamydoabsidia padenii]
MPGQCTGHSDWDYTTISDFGEANSVGEACNQLNFNKYRKCIKCHQVKLKPVNESQKQARMRRQYTWASDRPRYENRDKNVDQGSGFPRNLELEKEMFGKRHYKERIAVDFSSYETDPNVVENGDDINLKPLKSLNDADLHPTLKESIALAGYINPTPVQQYALPIITLAKDLMACAQTESGKTPVFLLPTMSSLMGRPEITQSFTYCHNRKVEPLLVILTPTRALCSQLFVECCRWSYRSYRRPCAVYGGANKINQLERGCNVSVATPGRLLEFIGRKRISLCRVQYFILDEADRMLDMGFEPLTRNIVEYLGNFDYYLYDNQLPTTSIHGERTQLERENALLSFDAGNCPILVATDVTACGIDIADVMHVINYDLPCDIDVYVHRNGRTARVGKPWLATSFYNDFDECLGLGITRLLEENNQTVPEFLQPYAKKNPGFGTRLG